MNISKVAASLAIATMVGCASSPQDIPAYYVSPKKYDNFTCDEIGDEAVAMSNHMRSLYGDASKAHATDVALTATSLVLFWPALFFLGGNEADESQYSVLKGEVNAIELASNRKGCDITFGSGS